MHNSPDAGDQQHFVRCLPFLQMVHRPQQFLIGSVLFGHIPQRLLRQQSPQHQGGYLLLLLPVQQFYGGDGLVAKGVENSIANFSRLGRVGMRETDREIIKMMTE